MQSGPGYTVYKTPQDVLDNEGNNFWVIGGPQLILAFHEMVGYDIIYHSLIYGEHKADVIFENFNNILNSMTLISEKIYDNFEIKKFANENKF